MLLDLAILLDEPELDSGSSSTTITRRKPPVAPPPGHGHLHITVRLHGEGRVISAWQVRQVVLTDGHLFGKKYLERDEAEAIALALRWEEFLP